MSFANKPFYLFIYLKNWINHKFIVKKIKYKDRNKKTPTEQKPITRDEYGRTWQKKTKTDRKRNKRKKISDSQTSKRLEARDRSKEKHQKLERRRERR